VPPGPRESDGQQQFFESTTSGANIRERLQKIADEKAEKFRAMGIPAARLAFLAVGAAFALAGGSLIGQGASVGDLRTVLAGGLVAGALGFGSFYIGGTITDEQAAGLAEDFRDSLADLSPFKKKFPNAVSLPSQEKRPAARRLRAALSPRVGRLIHHLRSA